MTSLKLTRQAQKTATRETLLAAARRCFARDGWHATTVGSIAREAKVAHGTFYVHFATKEAAMDALVAELNAVMATRLAPTFLDTSAALEDRVRSGAKALITHWRRERDFVRAYAERLGDGVSLTALRDGVNPPAESLVRSAIEGFLAAAATPKKRAALATQGLLALWLRVGLQAVFNPSVRQTDAVEVLTRMTVGALRGLKGDRS